jgi:HEAT repeat protein
MNKPELVERVARAMCETSKTVPRADFRVLATAAIEELGVERLVAALEDLLGDPESISRQADAREALSSLSKGRG